MKCPNCGAQMGLEDAVCPYCKTPNAMAVQHQSDMAHYRDEYERTQAQVLKNTSLLQRHASWLAILVFLLIALIVGLGLLGNAWDIGYSMREGDVEKTIAADRQVMDAYLEQGDYGKFAGYYEANDINLSSDTSYMALHTAAGEYVELLGYVAALNNPNDSAFGPERASDTCAYVADCLNRIYTLEEQYSYNLDEYLPDSMRVYVEDIRERAGVIAVAYFGLTADDVDNIPNMSTRKLATLIEEGIAS